MNKDVAFYIPARFEATNNFKKTGTILAFYWLNNGELITCKSQNTGYTSINCTFIGIFGALSIFNDRRRDDSIFLSRNDWSGIKQGTDGYPAYDEKYWCYCIAGGGHTSFKAAALEISGVKLCWKFFKNSLKIIRNRI